MIAAVQIRGPDLVKAAERGAPLFYRAAHSGTLFSENRFTKMKG
jgi:hypothetical protein